MAASFRAIVGLRERRWEFFAGLRGRSVRPDIVVGNLEALHGRGIRIAIDDFGTWYSSLNYLKRYPRKSALRRGSVRRAGEASHEEALKAQG